MPTIPIPLIPLIFLLPQFLAKNGQPLDESIFLEKAEPAARCWTNWNGQQEGHWVEQGERVDRGKYWFECGDGGKLEAGGCLDDQGKRIPLNGTFTSNGYLLECQLWGGFPRPKTVGCSPNNEETAFRVGQNWDQGENWWECAWEGDRLKQQMRGCLVEEKGGKRRLAIGERVDLKEEATTYECQQSAQREVKLVAIGCIAVEAGEHRRIGQQWKEGDFLFYCKRMGVDKCQKACIGCSLQGQNLFDGDRFRLNGSIFQCEIRPKRHVLKPIACSLSGGVERVVDCKWHEQAANGHIVERQCVVRAGRAVVDTLGCIFAKEGINRLFLRQGTYTFWRESVDEGKPLGIACRQPAAGDEDGGEPELLTFPAEEAAKWTRGLEMETEPRQ